MLNRHTRLLAVLATTAVAAACADVAGPGGSSLSSRAAQLDGEELNPQILELCKIGPVGSTATFSVSTTSGTLPLGNSVTLAATDLVDGCTVVWRASYPRVAGDVSTVTITEVGSTPGTILEYIVQFSSIDGWAEPDVAGKTAVIRVDYDRGGKVWFKNVGTPIIDRLQGCTPGYWKVPQHWDSYPAPYLPTTLFGTVFANAFPGKNFVQVMSLQGGGLQALGRHTVAALLNAASGSVAYGYTPEEVISAFNAAYASGNYETQKNIFEAKNEKGCPLN